MSREPKRLGVLGTVIMVLVILGLIAATGFVVWLCIDMVNLAPENAPSTDQAVVMPTESRNPTEEMPTETTVPPTTTEPPQPETVIATATISSQGDLLMHKPVFDTCRQGDGTYDFESLFRYLKDTVSAFDYAAVNLETTFGGDSYIYQGNPHFNCPDPLADSVADAGFDMLLTANNHCGDTTAYGIKRTLEVIRDAGLEALGTMSDAEASKFSVVDVNGIKIGMTCFTYATGVSADGRPALNGNAQLGEAGLVNYFMESNLDKFYSEVEQQLADMEAQGAEATMLFIHWGIEYQTKENTRQNTIAQKLCDLGVDVIVGGHPHVVQPVSLLESTVDPSHKTVCIYSLGNAVSNQRTGISNLFPPGYTEDGALFTVTFEKYSDGKVYLADTDVIPTWVNMHSNEGRKEYNILPLTKDTEDTWQETYKLTDYQFECCQKSYTRTMGIVGLGVEGCKGYLEQAKADREQYYYDLAYNPEKFATEASAETIPEETVLPAA